MCHLSQQNLGNSTKRIQSGGKIMRLSFNSTLLFDHNFPTRIKNEEIPYRGKKHVKHVKHAKHAKHVSTPSTLSTQARYLADSSFTVPCIVCFIVHVSYVVWYMSSITCRFCSYLIYVSCYKHIFISSRMYTSFWRTSHLIVYKNKGKGSQNTADVVQRYMKNLFDNNM